MKLSELLEITGNSEDKCFFCGDRIMFGAHWHEEESIAICSNEECLEKLFHILIDAVWDARRDIKHNTKEHLDILSIWTEKLKKVYYWKWTHLK